MEYPRGPLDRRKLDGCLKVRGQGRMLKNVITRSVYPGGAIAKFLAIGLGGSISIDLPQPTTWLFSHEWELTPKS